MGYEIIPTILLVLLKTLGIYSTILIVRVLLTWFPNLDMSNPILVNLCAITDPYLNFFRGIIPPLGGLDLSPILAFVVIRVLLTWFPNLDMSNPILVNLCAITDPYLNFFRGIIPPLGGLDLSPILAFVVIRVVQGILGNAAALAMGGLQMYG